MADLYENPLALNLIKRFEGYAPKPAWDHKQYSVGFGTRWQPGQPIGTKSDHEAALAREAGAVDSWIAQNVKVPLDPNKRAALTSAGYNIGTGRTGLSRLLGDINSANWDRVGQRLLSFNKASGSVNPGLVNRRKQEVALMLGGALPAAAPTASPDGASTPMAAPIGGGPVAGGPIPLLTPANPRNSKLAELFLAKAANAQPDGWGTLLQALGNQVSGAGYAQKADEESKSYQGQLAQALMGATNETLPQTLIASGDPELVKAGVSARIAANKSAEPTQDIREYQFDMKQRQEAGQPSVPFNQWVKEVKAKQADSGYGTSPQYYRRKDGSIGVGQMSKAGGMKAAELPEDGAEWMPPTFTLDTETEQQIRTRAGAVPVETVKKDIAGAASLKKQGDAAGEAKADLPRVESNSDAITSMIDNVLNDPYLPSMTGAVQGRMPNLTGDAQRVQAKVDQINGQAFLQAFSALKGGGAITEAEGAKATASLSRLQNMKVNSPDYLQALQDFKGEVGRLRDLARRRAGVMSQQGLNQRLQSAPSPDQPTPVKTLRFNPQTGEIE